MQEANHTFGLDRANKILACIYVCACICALQSSSQQNSPGNSCIETKLLQQQATSEC